MKCIYCKIESDAASFTKPEHVIPQSFGLFQNNLTLWNVVCDDCNQYFGDNIELLLARDSIEGGYRFKFDIRKPHTFKSMGKSSRLVIKAAEGQYKGAYVYREYSQMQGKVVIKPLPQIGFLKPDRAEYQYYLLNDIPDRKYLEDNGFDLKQARSIIILSCNAEESKRILHDKDIELKVGGELPMHERGSEQDWLCEVEATVDQIILRAIAKIAFNYLAYGEKSAFLLHDSFDTIRNYIRYGQKCSYPLIRVSNTPILKDEPIEGKRRAGHMITLNWAADRVSIISQVSLFNLATYIISLARDFSGERREIRRGHFFNIYSKEILPLDAR
jgi:hypothetical protein